MTVKLRIPNLLLHWLASICALSAPALDGSGLTNKAQITDVLYLEVRSDRVPHSGLEFNSDDWLIYGVITSEAKPVKFRRIPDRQAFRLVMLDSDGAPVPKRALAREWEIEEDKAISKPDVRLKSQHAFPGHNALRWLFRPDQMFEMKAPGEYVLEIRLRIGVYDAAGHFSVKWSGPVRLKIMHKSATSKKQ